MKQIPPSPLTGNSGSEDIISPHVRLFSTRAHTHTHFTSLQGYVVCPSEQRFLLLFTFLKKNLGKKVMVFFSSCNSVKFHSELLNYVDISVMDIHVS